MRTQIVVLKVEAPDDETITELMTGMPTQWDWSELADAPCTVIAAGPVVDDGRDEDPDGGDRLTDWQYEVANGDTKLGYRAWLTNR